MASSSGGGIFAGISPIALGLTGLGAIGSLFGGPKPPSFDEIQKRFGPDALAKLQQILFSNYVSNPAFRMNLANANVTGQQASQDIDANLAKAGLSSSGVGSAASGLGGAISGFQQQNLVGQAGQAAAGQATDLNSLLANLFMQSKGMQMNAGSPLQKASGALLGSLGPALAGPRIGSANTGDFSAFMKPFFGNQSYFPTYGVGLTG